MGQQLSKWFGVVALGASLGLSAVAWAQEVIGVPVTIQVIDPTGNPIPTAVVRHPLEAQRHAVNAATGEWTESFLYMQDGTEFVFQKGVELELEVSAPGYVNQRFKYLIKKRKNLVPIVLQPMVLEEEEEDDMGPTIQFGRDKPID